MSHLARIPIVGKLEMQFWIRSLQLQKDIDNVVKILDQDPRRKTAFSPIIFEYEAGSMMYHVLLGATIDSLGLEDGQGFVWISTGKEAHQKAEKERNSLAKEMIESLEQRNFDEVMEIESGREK